MKSLRHITILPALLVYFFLGTQSAQALTISPVKVEVTGEPGQTLRGEVELLNEQSQPKTFFSSFENFEPSGDTGSPKFIGSSDGLATWLQAEPSTFVSVGETVKIPYAITIPAETEPGGYFAAIFWGEQNPNAQLAGEVAIGGKLGVLILLRVAGDIVENAGITEFEASSSSRLFFGLPISLSYRFANSGGDRVVPLGDITIKNTFGRVAAILPANINEGSVLPNSARKFNVVWGEQKDSADTHGFFAAARKQLSDFRFGLYKADINVIYGATNQAATASLWFIMLPWQLLTLIFAGMVTAVFALKKYNSWIIKKSKSSV